ncbi:MAG: hypothetical protein QOH83_1876 [Solirubrobacteraceae bacterium]|nr:hypothetical protein [Solirubrobacteraceae bacterium]
MTGRRTYDAAIEVRIRLHALQAERAVAGFEGLATNRAYMTDLDHEIATATSAYVGAVVTEIAILRAELTGPQVG